MALEGCAHCPLPTARPPAINNCITSHCLCAQVGLCTTSPAKPSRFIPRPKVESGAIRHTLPDTAGSSLPHYLRNIRKHESCDDDGLETCQPSPQNSQNSQVGFVLDFATHQQQGWLAAAKTQRDPMWHRQFAKPHKALGVGGT